jgi:hypothetical protein
MDSKAASRSNTSRSYRMVSIMLILLAEVRKRLCGLQVPPKLSVGKSSRSALLLGDA